MQVQEVGLSYEDQKRYLHVDIVFKEQCLSWEMRALVFQEEILL